MLRLQNGRFDLADRLFFSVERDWQNCYEQNGCVKELIPEFYQHDTDFLVNRQNLDLGRRQNGKAVGDVELPKWARNAEHFLETNRQALESDYVSFNLHH